MTELSLAVVGLDFPNADRSNRRFEMAMCVPGEPVYLQREPRNKADPRAIAVYSARRIQLGYLTAERAPYIGGLLAYQSCEAFFQDVGHYAAIIRVRFGGGAPTLPAPRTAPIDHDRGEPDFYPDADGPEWGA